MVAESIEFDPADASSFRLSSPDARPGSSQTTSSFLSLRPVRMIDRGLLQAYSLTVILAIVPFVSSALLIFSSHKQAKLNVPPPAFGRSESKKNRDRLVLLAPRPSSRLPFPPPSIALSPSPPSSGRRPIPKLPVLT